MAVELALSVDSLSTLIPKIKLLISPILSVGYNLQKSQGNVNMKRTLSSGSGLWSSCVSVNATAGILHTEKDCTYTLITVPKQHKMVKGYNFLFHLNTENICQLSLNEDISLLFSGLCLSHKQIYDVLPVKDDDLFINLSSYGNQKLFTHLRKLFSRNINNE